MFYVFLASFEAVVNLSVDMILPALSTIATAFNVDIETSRFLVSAWFFGSYALNFVMQYFLHSIGRKRLLIVGAFCFSIASILCVIAPSFYVLCILRVMQGLAFGLIYVAGHSIFHEIYSGARSVKALSTVQIIAISSPMLGPILGLLIMQNIGWRAIFIVLAVLGLVNVFTLWKFTPSDRNSKVSDGKSNDFSSWIKGYVSLFKNNGFVRYLLMHCVRFGMSLIFTANAAVMLSKNGISESIFVAMQTFCFFSFIGGLFASGKVIGKISLNALISVGLLISFVGSVALYLTTFLPTFDVLAVAISVSLVSFGGGLFASPVARLAVEASGVEMSMVTTVMSTFYSLSAFLSVLASQLFLSVSSQKDISIVMIVSCVVIFLLYMSKKEQPKLKG
jgi:DHA1 family bicyclomycin/chloramphenicol resistance-like MFS transporter